MHCCEPHCARQNFTGTRAVRSSGMLDVRTLAIQSLYISAGARCIAEIDGVLSQTTIDRVRYLQPFDMDALKLFIIACLLPSYTQARRPSDSTQHAESTAARFAAQGRVVHSGDLLIPYTYDNAAINIDPRSPNAMPTGCSASATSDFASRQQLPQYSSRSRVQSSWGPHLNVYPGVQATQVPPQCNPTAWAWQRLLAAIQYTISLDINYCHHHAPAYVTPTIFRVGCNPIEAGVDQPGCVCNTAGLTARANGWQGLDCSNYVAWIYNFAFGYYPTSSIGQQACSTTAPGRLLNTVTLSKLNLLNPGDLLFIKLSSVGNTPPVRVSHVVLWTGWMVDFTPGVTGPLAYDTLLTNLHAKEKSSVIACIKDRRAQGLPVYVISDSHYTGPNLRPFCGWYMNSFSHARRVINPDSGLYPYKNLAGIAYYSSSKGDCMSNWALKG